MRYIIGGLPVLLGVILCSASVSAMMVKSTSFQRIFSSSSLVLRVNIGSTRLVSSSHPLIPWAVEVSAEVLECFKGWDCQPGEVKKFRLPTIKPEAFLSGEHFPFLVAGDHAIICLEESPSFDFTITGFHQGVYWLGDSISTGNSPLSTLQPGVHRSAAIELIGELKEISQPTTLGEFRDFVQILGETP